MTNNYVKQEPRWVEKTVNRISDDEALHRLNVEATKEHCAVCRRPCEKYRRQDRFNITFICGDPKCVMHVKEKENVWRKS